MVSACACVRVPAVRPSTVAAPRAARPCPPKSDRGRQVERLKSHRDFVHVVKQRTKVTSRDLVVHFCMRESGSHPVGVRMGLAVSKNVGHAVTRNAVKRRFRVLARAHEQALPAGCDIVMRAKPSAAHAAFQSLDAQVASSFAKVAKRLAASQNAADSHESPHGSCDAHHGE